MQLRTLFPVLGPALWNRQRHFGRAIALGLVGSTTLLVGGNALAETSSETATVKITAIELRNSKGVVAACMTTNPKGFPACQGDPNAYSVVVKAASSVTFSFKNVKPGRYAIALLHDENDNGKMDLALIMPKEGYGFSRDAKVRMGPPKFKSAAFDVTKDDQLQTIKMRYIL